MMKVQLEAIASILANIQKQGEEQKELQLAVVMQLIELNGLIKKLNLISGTDIGITKKEVEDELKFLGTHIENFTDIAKETVKKISALTYTKDENKNASEKVQS